MPRTKYTKQEFYEAVTEPLSDLEEMISELEDKAKSCTKEQRIAILGIIDHLRDALEEMNNVESDNEEESGEEEDEEDEDDSTEREA